MKSNCKNIIGNECAISGKNMREMNCHNCDFYAPYRKKCYESDFGLLEEEDREFLDETPENA